MGTGVSAGGRRGPLEGPHKVRPGRPPGGWARAASLPAERGGPAGADASGARPELPRAADADGSRAEGEEGHRLPGRQVSKTP
eukprot:4023109-Pyramimonas_sp.AAC.1